VHGEPVIELFPCWKSYCIPDVSASPSPLISLKQSREKALVYSAGAPAQRRLRALVEIVPLGSVVWFFVGRKVLLRLKRLLIAVRWVAVTNSVEYAQCEAKMASAFVRYLIS
jgi:hypothetical protein